MGVGAPALDSPRRGQADAKHHVGKRATSLHLDLEADLLAAVEVVALASIAVQQADRRDLGLARAPPHDLLGLGRLAGSLGLLRRFGRLGLGSGLGVRQRRD